MSFVFQISLWLWFTVLFANFAEAMAEGRGKAQADALRKSRTKTSANKLNPNGSITVVAAEALRKGDIFVVAANELIAADGEIIEGAATVNESAITGESAPVIREAGADRSAVTGGTTVLSDQIKIRVTANPGESFMDRMIGLIRRRQTPERRLTKSPSPFLLSALTIILLVVCIYMYWFCIFTQNYLTAYGFDQVTRAFSVTFLIALMVCLIPTTIGGLLSAIGIAGIDRMVQKNVLAMSGRAVEAAGDVDVLLLDKTGTITLGNREAAEFIAAPGVSDRELAEAAQLSSLADETPEGRSIVVLAKHKYGVNGLEVHDLPHAKFVPFTALDPHERRRFQRRKRPQGRRRQRPQMGRRHFPQGNRCCRRKDQPRRWHSTCRRQDRPSPRCHLSQGHRQERPSRSVQNDSAPMGIKTVMITGDNPLTAAAIAAEAGVDDFLAQATPENKLDLLRKEQAAGHLVAMTGDGTNDAPALAQADVGVAMNTGTQAAKEAGNMVDLDSNPTKLIEVVEIGKQMLMTRGALTTFSVANDVAKYFAIIPVMLVVGVPRPSPR